MDKCLLHTGKIVDVWWLNEIWCIPAEGWYTCGVHKLKEMNNA